jgi:hypothetical protein
VADELGSMPPDFLTDPDVKAEVLEALSPECKRLLMVLGAATYWGALEVTS